MTAPTLHISRTEYAERLANTRGAMAMAGIELLVLSDPSKMAWLTGYNGWSFCIANPKNPRRSRRFFQAASLVSCCALALRAAIKAVTTMRPTWVSW
jgi:Xaa-Pro aminopeptidase